MRNWNTNWATDQIIMFLFHLVSAQQFAKYINTLLAKWYRYNFKPSSAINTLFIMNFWKYFNKIFEIFLNIYQSTLYGC